MILSPYQSTPCKDYDLGKIVREVIAERIDGKVLLENHPIEMIGPESTEVPIFTQPLTRYEFGDRRDAPQVVFDARALIRTTRGGDTPYTVSNYNEMEVMLTRARLQLFWQDPDQAKLDLVRAGDLPAITFINWLSKSLVGKLGLDPEHQMIISAVTGYYYGCLYYSEAEFDERAKTRLAQQISRWTRIIPADVLRITDPLNYLANIRDYITAIQACVTSSRVSQLSIGLLYALTGGAWYGGNSREVVAVSLEHPPTWLALVFSALQLRGYRSALLAKVVQMAVRGGNDRDLVKNLSFLLKDYDRVA